MTDIIKAISLWQPWASLWLSPSKRHETRHWETKHRGHLAVHAAKRFEIHLHEELVNILDDEFGNLWTRDLPTGALIGMVDLIDCTSDRALYCKPVDWTDDERIDIACGDFGLKRFGWRRGTYWVFREPIPFKGHQRLFNVPHDLVASAIATARVCG